MYVIITTHINKKTMTSLLKINILPYDKSSVLTWSKEKQQIYRENSEYQLCLDILASYYQPTKNVIKKQCSYGLKHEVENNAYQYMLDEVFTLCMYDLGYKCEKLKGSSKSYFFNAKRRRGVFKRPPYSSFI
jgi:hypothetical protein